MIDETQGDWRAWRRDQRARLLTARTALPSAARRDLAGRVLDNLDRLMARHGVDVLGIYWPIKREISVLDWAATLAARRHIRLALPVVTKPRAPLEYWLWSPNARMTRGIWSIPVPAERTVVAPDVVLAPLVGFQGRWRLGYGGGYFDRTLAAGKPAPAAIGIGFDLLEIEGFSPRPHDIPMQSVVTESRIIGEPGQGARP